MSKHSIDSSLSHTTHNSAVVFFIFLAVCLIIITYVFFNQELFEGWYTTLKENGKINYNTNTL